MAVLAMAVIAIGLVAFGVVLGLFVNGLADNLPGLESLRQVRRAEDLLLPRCAYCASPRRGREALAIAGMLVGSGQCPHCGAPRPQRDLWVELFLGAALPVFGVRSPISAGSLLGAAFVLGFFLLVTVIDLEHRLVVMEIILAGGLALLLLAAANGVARMVSSLLGAGAGGAVFLALYLLGFLFVRIWAHDSGEPALGFGDVLLAALVGLTTGWPAVLLALILGIVFAGLGGLGLLVSNAIRRRGWRGTTMAYGPYLALAAVVVYFFGSDLARWFLHLP